MEPNKKNLLLLEDNYILRNSLASSLREQGWNVDAYASTDEIKDYQKYNVALIDLILTEADGNLICGKIIRHKPVDQTISLAEIERASSISVIRRLNGLECIVIVLSRVIDSRIIRCALDAGVFWYIPKQEVLTTEEIIKTRNPKKLVREKESKIAITESQLREMGALVERAMYARIARYCMKYLPLDFMTEAKQRMNFFEPGFVPNDSIALYLDVSNSAYLWQKTRSPMGVTNALNEIFKIAIDFIDKGCVDSFIGDAMLIVFNVHRNLEENVYDVAIKAAESIKKAFIRQIQPKYPEIGLKIGIVNLNPDTSIIAHLGSLERKQLTVISEQIYEVSRTLSVLPKRGVLGHEAWKEWVEKLEDRDKWVKNLEDRRNPVLLIGNIIDDISSTYKTNNLGKAAIRGIYNLETSQEREVEVAELLPNPTPSNKASG